MGVDLLIQDKQARSFRVRSFAATDRRALEAMYADFDPKRSAQGLPPDGPTATRVWLDRVLARGKHLVAEMDGRLVAHVMLVPMEDGVLELANFVHQSARNQGIGTALNRIALDVAREEGCRRVWLSVEPSNRAAMRSYRNAGFKSLPGSLWAPELEMAIDLSPDEDGTGAKSS